MTTATSTVYDGPFAPILLTFVDDALVHLDVAHDGVDVARARIAHALGVLPDPDPGPGRKAAAQLDAYFDGSRKTFDIPLDWRLVGGFTRAALQATQRIPYGEVASYGEVAIMAGSPGAARAVGTACARTPFSIVVPVHRVVRSDGSIGEYGGHPEVKHFLLDLEVGVTEGLRQPASPAGPSLG